MNDQKQLKNYIGFSRDHSGSMSSHRQAAMKDYNSTIASIREEAIKHSQDTIVSTLKCGVGSGRNEWESQLSSVTALRSLTSYECSGMTPLFDSIDMLIKHFESLPDANDQNVSFLIMVHTDGGDNQSRTSASTLARKIRELQLTDRWTFVFRVPVGSKRELVNMGIPDGNIMEWDVYSTESFTKASVATQSAMSNFYQSRSVGVRSSTSFYADMSNVTRKEVTKVLDKITGEVLVFPVNATEMIAPFVERNLGRPMTKGCAFYELTKPERAVQDYKKIVIRDKKSDHYYGGTAARQMLGLPDFGTIALKPGDHGNFDIFVQSTSLNRKLMPNTKVVYWKDAV